MNTLLLVIGILFLAATLPLLVWQKLPASVSAFLALVALHFSTHICLPMSTFLFWGAATLIVILIDRLSPRNTPKAVAHGNVFLAIGAIAGMLLGMSVDPDIMILCTAIGTIFGQLIYSRTPNGRWIKFPSSVFIHYFCARGLKTIVAVAIIGIALEGFISNLAR